MLGGYAMELSAEVDFFIIWLFLVTGLHSGYAAATIVLFVFRTI